MGTDNMIPTSGKFQEPSRAKWDELEATAYECIVTSQPAFVRFLQNLYVPDHDVLFPPEDGWPQITKESLAALGKSDKVIEVLRNVAYIKGSFDSNTDEILTAGDAADALFATEPEEKAPRDVVGLTIGGRGGSTILLDCRNGIVRWPGCPDGRTSFGGQTRGDPAGEHQVDGMWGGETAWPVEEFFEYIMAKFVNLEQLVIEGGQVIKKDWITPKPIYDFDSFKDAYQRNGWPGADYNKDACMAEIKEFHKKRRMR